MLIYTCISSINRSIIELLDSQHFNYNWENVTKVFLETIVYLYRYTNTVIYSIVIETIVRETSGNMFWGKN